MNPPHPAPARLLPLLLLTGIAIALRFATLGIAPLIDPTEGRYAQIGYTMMATGDWVVPRLNDEPFWGKPPLSFWATALSLGAFGINEAAARLPSALAWAMCAGFAYVLAARRLGREAGLMAAIACATSLVSYASAGCVLTDPAFALTLAVVFVALPMSGAAQTRAGRVAWGYALFLGVGLSLLSKGLLALGIAGLAVCAWAFWTRGWRAVGRLPWLTGGILALAVAVPWHLAMETRSPGFLHYYIVGEHFERFLVPGWKSLYGESHTVPRGMIWLIWAGGNMPWLLLAGALAARHRSLFARGRASQDPAASLAVYCLCWLLAVPVLFTPARNVMQTYPLPGVTALGVLTALLLHEERRSGTAWQGWVTGRAALAAMVLMVPLSVTLFTFVLLRGRSAERSQRELVAVFDRLNPVEGRKILVYPEDVPYSALFYSRGRAHARADMKSGDIRREAARGTTIYYAIEARDMGQYRKYGFGAEDRVASVGPYGIYRTDAPPDESPD